MLVPWKKNYDKPRQHIEKQRHYFANKGLSSQSYGLPVVMYGCESWTIKKAERWRIDAFELTSCQIDGEKVETVANFLFLPSKITMDGYFSYRIKMLAMHKLYYDNPNSLFPSLILRNSQNTFTLPTWFVIEFRKFVFPFLYSLHCLQWGRCSINVGWLVEW